MSDLEGKREDVARQTLSDLRDWLRPKWDGTEFKSRKFSGPQDDLLSIGRMSAFDDVRHWLDEKLRERFDLKDLAAK